MNARLTVSVLLVLSLFSSFNTVSKNLCTAKLINSVPSGGTGTDFLQISPNGQLLAVANNTSNNVALFAFSEKCGTIDPNPLQTNIPIAAAYDVAFSPDGKLLAVTGSAENASSQITIFKVDKCSINLQPYTQIPTPNDIATISFSPDGRFLAAAFFASAQVKIYAVEKNGCVNPVPVQVVTTLNNPYYPRFSPKGDFLACVNIYPGTFTFFNVDTCTGNLSNEQSISSQDALPLNIAFSPTQKTFAIGHVSATISIFSYTHSGVITPIQSGVVSGEYAIGISYTKDGKCLIVGNLDSNNISIFKVKKTNTITLCAQLPSQCPFGLSLKDDCFVIGNGCISQISSYCLAQCKAATTQVQQAALTGTAQHTYRPAPLDTTKKRVPHCNN